jgi:hypothetical protein
MQTRADSSFKLELLVLLGMHIHELLALLDMYLQELLSLNGTQCTTTKHFLPELRSRLYPKLKDTCRITPGMILQSKTASYADAQTLPGTEMPLAPLRRARNTTA